MSNDLFITPDDAMNAIKEEMLADMAETLTVPLATADKPVDIVD